MAIERNTYTDILFDALMAAGCTIYGACAAMGNIYAESGANPRNLENLCEKKLNYKYTDDTYTDTIGEYRTRLCQTVYIMEFYIKIAGRLKHIDALQIIDPEDE